MNILQRTALLAVLACGTVLAGCAAAAPGPPAQRITVEGRPYLIGALTAATWIATLPTGPISTTSAGRSALLQAIEEHSGCKVTDADYSRGGLQLDAQLDCASRLKN